MNARLYDPVLGRFLGMDPYVQMPDFTQNFNRYSYALNNPLLFTDPSGAVIGIDDVLIGMAIGAVVGAISGSISYTVTTAMSGGQGDAGQFLKSVGIGLFSGAVSGAVPFLTTGIGSVFGHTLGNVGTELARATAHGLVTGGMNALQGGDFWPGFGVGAISSFAGSGMSALGMPSGALPYAMGGVGALSAWAMGGDPLSGFMQGYNIGALNHTGGGSFDDPYQLDEVTVEAYAPKSLQDWRFPNINPYLSNLSTILDNASSKHGMFNAGNSLALVNYPLAGMSIYNNFFDAYQGKASWGSFGYGLAKTGLSLYPPTVVPVAYYNSVESLMIGGLNYATEAKIRTEMWFNNVLTPGYWGFK